MLSPVLPPWLFFFWNMHLIAHSFPFKICRISLLHSFTFKFLVLEKIFGASTRFSRLSYVPHFSRMFSIHSGNTHGFPPRAIGKQTSESCQRSAISPHVCGHNQMQIQTRSRPDLYTLLVIWSFRSALPNLCKPAVLSDRFQKKMPQGTLAFPAPNKNLNPLPAGKYKTVLTAFTSVVIM